MCGIAGIWCDNVEGEDQLSRQIDIMLSALTHRGPDDGGFAVGERVALGNRRLSIFDLSSAGHQPFFSRDGRIWLVFNGEIYNHPELRKTLEQDFKFISNTDTEVVLYAYEKWGIECLKYFNGMFAIAIWDGSKDTLHLCRDRLGIKPLYYHFDGSTLRFASEIKAILAAGVQPSMNNSVVQDYLLNGFYDHTEKTFFKNIQQVRQGSVLTFRSSNLSEHKYWDLTNHLATTEIQDAEEQYRELLNDAVGLRMRADVPCAVLLSGGLDSSVIAHLADVQNPMNILHVSTFRHEDSKYDEGPWADLVAEGKGWHHHNLVLKEQHVADMLPEALWHQDEPFGSVATFADMLLAKQARENGIYVLLEGQGADETLGGYEYYYNYYLSDLAGSDPQGARSLYEEFRRLRYDDDSQLSGPSFEEMCRRGEKVLGGVGQDGTVSILNGVLSKDFKSDGEMWSYRSPSQSRFESCLFRDLAHTKVPRVLRFKDKASMKYGVELRVPFLDHRLVELSCKIPPRLKLNKGYTKHCLRNLMSDILPSATCFHVKRQIQTPQREWLRGALRPLVEEVIYSKTFADRGVFNVKKVRRIYQDYLERPGHYPNLFFIWQWLQLEWWFRIFFDKSVSLSFSETWVNLPNHRRSHKPVC